METQENVKRYISEEEYRTVLKLANRDAGVEQPFLLHGDLGFHNFIFQENKLHGVIDPLPVLGRSYIRFNLCVLFHRGRFNKRNDSLCDEAVCIS